MSEHRERVLITGGRGVMGRALHVELVAAGYEDVTSVSSDDANLTDERATVELFEQSHPSLVFHLAARVYGIMGNQANMAAAFLDNIRINTNVIEAARLAGAHKIVAMGSTAVYSDGIPLPMRESDIWMGPPHESEAPYAHAKRAMYAQLEAYSQQYGLQYAYCVSTNLYGPHDRFDERWGHVIPSLISKFHRAATKGDPMVVWGTGEATRDFLFAADAARAMRIIAEEATGPINLASGTTHTIRQAVDVLQAIAGYRGEVDWDASKPDGQRERVYDVSRLRGLGFTPSYDLEQGLDITYRWFSENAASVRR